jgi:hypothetical protein
MNVDEYLAWAEGRPGRYELYGGVVYAMARERAGDPRIQLFAMDRRVKPGDDDET